MVKITMSKKVVSKNDLAKQVAAKLSLTKSESLEYLNTLLAVVQDNLKNGETVQVKKFFKLTPAPVAERKYTANYATAPVVVPAHNGLRFNISRTLIDSLN